MTLVIDTDKLIFLPSGILLCARHLVPAIADLQQSSSLHLTSTSLSMSSSSSSSSSQTNLNPEDLSCLHERCLQLYELTLHYLDHTDHNVVTHSLETLQQLLKTPPQVSMHTKAGFLRNWSSANCDFIRGAHGVLKP